jgi:3-phenylpropionate/trans-cinnamate dioxygenase ferredoxin reductase subunit
MERSVDVLLLGGGVAAARCARTLRRHGFDGSILLVGDEALPPYNRPPLSKELLRGDIPSDLVLAEPLAWYERRRVELSLGTPAEALDPGLSLVTLADGARIHFGQLLIATGAEPRRPPIPGAEHARLLRTLSDAEELRSAAVAGARAVVIGGGFIGVEVASSLAARDVGVTVLEAGAALWGGSLGAPLSDWAQARLAGAGVTIRIGSAATRVGTNGVWLDEEEVSASLVLAGVGVSPRVGLAADAGLQVHQGIVVDEAQRSSSARIFAAGDVARRRGERRVEHWHAARESGERAALAMLGQPATSHRAPWIFSEVAGVGLDVVGSAPRWDEIVEERGVFAYVVDGTVAQVAVIDSAVPAEGARAFVEQHPPISLFAHFVAGHR